MFSWNLPRFGEERVSDSARDEEPGILDEAIHLEFQRRDLAVAFRFEQHSQGAGDSDVQITGHGAARGFVHDQKIGRPFQRHGDGLRFARVEGDAEDSDHRAVGGFMHFDPSFGMGLLQGLFAGSVFQTGKFGPHRLGNPDGSELRAQPEPSRPMMERADSGEVLLTTCIGQVLGDVLFQIVSGDAASGEFVTETELAQLG